MSKINGPHYFLEPLAPFPARWRDKYGPIRVMAGPVKGYVMCRRAGAAPFVLHVSELCNAKKHEYMGPFEVVGVKLTTVTPADGGGK